MRDSSAWSRHNQDDPPAWLMWLFVVVALCVVVGIFWVMLNSSAVASALDGDRMPLEQSLEVPAFGHHDLDPHRFCTPEHHICLDKKAERCVLPKPQPEVMMGGLAELMSKASPCVRWIRVRLPGEPDELLFCVENEKPRPVTPPAPSYRCLLNGICRMA